MTPESFHQLQLSLFNYAMPEDLKDADAYAKTRLMATSQDFITFAKFVITKEKMAKFNQFQIQKTFTI